MFPNGLHGEITIVTQSVGKRISILTRSLADASGYDSPGKTTKTQLQNNEETEMKRVLRLTILFCLFNFSIANGQSWQWETLESIGAPTARHEATLVAFEDNGTSF